MIKNFIEINPEIKKALKKKLPVVGLESTLISHGLPYPINIKVAENSEKLIRSSGSIPATIGIINGKIKVGLNNKEINILAKRKNVQKISTHNLSLVLNNNKYASTTVASSIMIAELVGIKVFSTGGIGGVHRNSEYTYDISSDLKQLDKSNMLIICSGVKSILDVFKTHEMLETIGITRIGYKTNKVPGFWFDKTKLDVDLKINNIKELIKIINNRKKLNQKNSILIYNPVPKKFSLKNKDVERWILLAEKKAKKNKIIGKDLTPYLLKEISILSNNLTLNTNISLILNNAKLAGKISYLVNKYI